MTPRVREPSACDEAVVARYATGLAETLVTRRGSAYTWRRHLGVDVRDDPDLQPRRVPADFARRATDVSSDEFELALPTETWDEGHTWIGPGPSSVAHVLMAPTPEDVERVVPVALVFGSHLRRFHATEPAPPAHEYGSLAYASRLVRWMGNARGTRGAAPWHRVLSAGLGPARWKRLAEWTEEARSTPEPPTVAVGWASWGSVVVPDGAQPGLAPALLCGDQGCAAAPEEDLGCALGELCEIEVMLRRRGDPHEHVGRVREAVLRGYGEELDRSRAGRAATVRVAAHAHDFAAFVGFHLDLRGYVGLLAELLEQDGIRALS